MIIMIHNQRSYQNNNEEEIECITPTQLTLKEKFELKIGKK